MKIIKFAGLVVILIFFSCTRTVELDLEKEPDKIVVNSFICPDSTVKVLLSHTIPINVSGRPLISNAKVNLYKNDIFIERLDYENDVYKSSSSILANNTYQIEIETGSYSFVSAKDSVPDAPVLIETKFIPNYLLEYDEQGMKNYISRLELTLFDNANQENYYELFMFLMYKSDYDDGYLLRAVGYEKNECEIINQEGIIDYNPSSIVFSNRLFTSEQQKININVLSGIDFINFTSGIYSDLKAVVFLRKTSKSYYEYQKSLTLHQYFQARDGDLWGSPLPVDLYSNVQNGLGIFAAYNETRDTIRFNTIP